MTQPLSKFRQMVDAMRYEVQKTADPAPPKWWAGSGYASLPTVYRAAKLAGYKFPCRQVVKVYRVPRKAGGKAPNATLPAALLRRFPKARAFRAVERDGGIFLSEVTK